MSYIEGLPPLPKCFSGVVGLEVEKLRNVVEEDEEQVSEVEGSEGLYNGEPDLSESLGDNTLTGSDSNGYNSFEEDNSPFTKLNNALNKLKDEMVSINLSNLFSKL